MQIFTSIDAVDIDLDALLDAAKSRTLEEEFGTDILAALEYALEDMDLSEYGLKPHSKDEFIFGVADPREVVKTARYWNSQIKEAFAAQVKKLGQAISIPDSLPLDNADTNKLRLAAEALDNHWVPAGDFGTYLSREAGCPYYSVILTDDAVKDIKARPERYIIVNANFV